MMFKNQNKKLIKFKHDKLIVWKQKTEVWNLKLLAIVLSLFMTFGFYSCDNALFDSGETTTKEIVFAKKITDYEAESIFDITLVQDTVSKVLVTCGENLHQFVDITLKNDTLHLKHHTKQNWSRKYEKIKLELHINNSFRMNIHEPINLTTKGTLHLEEFRVIDWDILSEIDVDIDVNICELSNAPEHFGSIKAQGKSNYLQMYNGGSCLFHLENLETKTCYIWQFGNGDIFVHVTNYLYADLRSTGNIYYKGNPSNIVIANQLSTGTLIDQN
jgi:hypothetical protein